MNPLFKFPGVRVVESFEELVATPFADTVNALCWPRVLAGDFDEIVTAVVALVGDAEITSLDEDDLMSLELSPAGSLARTALIDDLRRLSRQGLDPNLDCIPAYPREAEPGPVPLDVYSWHADSANVLADTWLCSYTAPASEGLSNAQAICCVDVPETRAALLRSFGGEDDAAFRAHLAERCYDLHYDARAGAEPYSFGVGNLWRIATQCPGSPVPPCVHRAPMTAAGQAPRLLMIT
ncbi:hypothetical protein [Synoicihabitans lomoniglobus]|uniref:DUF1826 domain-containing protein n=1 Tax=Synoicihabitans lomoniglobus TaxID=2909285 RepID=A0AAE9ZWS2_9BACT|nr:hypothetical protein [Opitutaceae bacterium LMO-M01]WED65577.1 hypothetical protein PXH66_01770 [Opitutaceae bacterium LMO-M01]